MDNPKVLVLAGLLVAALFVFAVVWGGTQRDQMAVPDPEDPGAMGSLESVLHGLPGLGPGRSLGPGDLFGAGCGSGRNLQWSGLCRITVPEDVGVIVLEHRGSAVRVELAQEGAVRQRLELPRDLRDGRVRLRAFGDGGVLDLRCRQPSCQLHLADGG